MIIVINKKSGKRGVAITANNNKILVKYGHVKIWGLAKNFEFEDGDQVEPQHIIEMEKEFRAEPGALLSFEVLKKLSDVKSSIMKIFYDEGLSWGEAHLLLDTIRFFIAEQNGGYLPLIDVRETLNLSQIVFLSPESPYTRKVAV